MLKRATRLLMLYILILTTVFSAVPLVQATPMDHPNTYKNTGNMRADIIGVALTQVGYYEGANNDTKYGVWFGLNNRGWCGIFVAWCADQAGIPKSIIPKNGTTIPANFKATVYSGKNYRPLPGDLFFTKSGSGYSHVGIVYYLDGDYFYTLEGNTYHNNGPEGVYISHRKIADYDFGVPNYPVGDEHTYHVGYESAHPHKEYYRCDHCNDQYYTGKTQASSTCKECIAANCSHSYGSWTSSGSSQHTKSCTKCGKKEAANHTWDSGKTTRQPTCAKQGQTTYTCTVCSATRTASIPVVNTHSYGAWKRASDTQHARYCQVCSKKETASHTWDSGKITKQPTCAKQGQTTYTCTVCSATRTASIPVLTTHDFGDWESVNAKQHTRICQVCSKKETATHSIADVLTWDDNGHWYACADCSGHIQEEKHTFGVECDSPCQVCGFSREGGHRYSTDWETNSNDHWHNCEVCNIPSPKTVHIFDDPCDGLCDICGYERQVAHSFSADLRSDEAGHWSECTQCGLTSEATPHQPGAAATEEQPQLCALCGWEMAPKLVHSHNYKPTVKNVLSHSMVCPCGAQLENEGHSWDIAALGCSICGFSFKDSLPTLLLLCAVPATALLFGLLLLIHRLKRRFG